MESIIQSAVSKQVNGGLGYIGTLTEDKQVEDFADANDAKIVVVGAGGMGCNAINRLHSVGVVGAETISVNTDLKHLRTVQSDRKILIGDGIYFAYNMGSAFDKRINLVPLFGFRNHWFVQRLL